MLFQYSNNPGREHKLRNTWDSERDSFFRDLGGEFHGKTIRKLFKNRHAQTTGTKFILQNVSKSIILRF